MNDGNSLNYFVLDRSFALNPARIVETYPNHEGVFWFAGARFATNTIPEPVEVTLEPFNASYQAQEIAEYIPGTVPLFRLDLIEALREAGVDNLDLYDAVIIDPDNGARHTTHKAANIIGVIAAADLGRSVATVNPGGAVIDVSFDSVALNEAATGGARLFRLAESPTTILLHRSVREHLDSKGFTKLWYLDPEDVAIL
jgi:hypothetical protein